MIKVRLEIETDTAAEIYARRSADIADVLPLLFQVFRQAILARLRDINTLTPAGEIMARLVAMTPEHEPDGGHR